MRNALSVTRCGGLSARQGVEEPGHDAGCSEIFAAVLRNEEPGSSRRSEQRESDQQRAGAEAVKRDASRIDSAR